ncbi:hypothetical protein [Alkaliphilus sp. B6464]|uniref:hypothetical protein n=1 Tax=Alkaliphilus sp. B6464 TaxID=2731219 RepID=UPI001BAD2CD2|nr:hypothetical protein [Alkaliphilus sp. B6464]QUH21828.1 hypothetical protein HYG84_17990 [Alkaliphilus sp. B6464]
MKIETFIKNEVRKYKTKALTNKKKGVNLDKLESMSKTHQSNCENFIHSKDLSYSEQCRYNEITINMLQQVDDELFGCFNGQGVCIGYDYYR